MVNLYDKGVTKHETFNSNNESICLFLEKHKNVDFWYIHVKSNKIPIGFIRVHHDGIVCKANVSGSDIFEKENQNKGYGSMCIKMLSKHYGAISSAANGSSSDQAIGMWIKAVATKINIKTLYTDHIYVLNS